ncbi:hypothetical protein [Acidovorax sp. BLS4]|nr:hypothetical protein [Paracidovorax avenae]WOI43750.1 hypothetical protein R1Z03_14510 [Paracidovorax avenae]
MKTENITFHRCPHHEQQTDSRQGTVLLPSFLIALQSRLGNAIA